MITTNCRIHDMMVRSVAPILTMALGAGCVPTGMNGGNGGTHTRPITLKFAAVVGEETATCGTMYAGMGATGENCEILDLRFYVSNIRLINDEGQEIPLTLEQDGKWQVENVALLDFENGTGKCGDAGTVDVNTQVIGTVPEGTYNGIVVDVGVPFELNHNDLTAAPAPLNVSAMFWTWAIGHKFLRLDMETESGLRWNMHLGSTMCDSNGPMDPPAVKCARPNQPVVVLHNFDPHEDTIVFDVMELFSSSDLTQDTPDTASGCQTFPDDINECAALFPNLGLDFSTGECVDDCANQTVFRVGTGEFMDFNNDAAIARGQTTFTTLHTTTAGTMLACASCHGDGGAGLIGPDIRSSTHRHLEEHAQGDGPHPEGVKFAGLTEQDFEEIELYLRSLCELDPDCTPGSVDEHDHD